MVYNVEKISSSHNNKEKEVNENDHNIYVWNSIEKSNARTPGRRGTAVNVEDIENPLHAIIAEDLPNLEKEADIKTQGVLRTPRDMIRVESQHSSVKMSEKTQSQDNIKIYKGKCQLICQGKHMRTRSELSLSTLKPGKLGTIFLNQQSTWIQNFV